MMINKIAVCPICGKRTWLRIQDGGYLNEYPIRANCINCRALIKGVYIMDPKSPYKGLHLLNAEIEEQDPDPDTLTMPNVDYVAEISGELPCKKVYTYEGGLPTSPFLAAVDHLESVEARIERLKYFTKNMMDWRKRKSIAFELLDEGSVEYIATALNNKMGDYKYECDNYLKALHCLQEVVLEETKYLFLEPGQDEYLANLRMRLAELDKDSLQEMASQMGGVEDIILTYRKIIEVFSSFMNVYPNLLPAETFMRFIDKEHCNDGIATCSFGDIKEYYQDAYEAILLLMYIPVCLDNIATRGDFKAFDIGLFADVKPTHIKRDFKWYRSLDNGTRLNKLNVSEQYQAVIDLPANRFLRNGIGHNNVKYDSITQIVTAFDLRKPNKIKYQNSLMSVAVDCIGLARSAVIMSEMILYILRQEFRTEGIRTVMHPRFYKGIEPNMKCPCGSGIKYKKCCRTEVDQLLYMAEKEKKTQ